MSVRTPLLLPMVWLMGVPALVLGLPKVACARPRAPRMAAPLHGEAAVWSALSARHDANGDGRILPQEYTRDPATFRRLDRNRDGVLTSADFKGPTRMGRLVARSVLLRYFQADANQEDLDPCEVAIAFRARDLNRNCRLDHRDLWRVRRAFHGKSLGAPEMPGGLSAWPHVLEAMDRDRSGDLSCRELVAFAVAEERESSRSGQRKSAGARSTVEGPEVGDEAPDFTLLPPSAGDPIRMSSLRGQPVALIFGSFT